MANRNLTHTHAHTTNAKFAFVRDEKNARYVDPCSFLNAAKKEVKRMKEKSRSTWSKVILAVDSVCFCLYLPISLYLCIIVIDTESH